MSLNLNLLSLATICFIVTSSVAYENKDKVAAYYRRFQIPDLKKLLRIDPENEDLDGVRRTTRTASHDYDQESIKPHKSYHIKFIVPTLSEEKSARKDTLDFNWKERKKMSLDDLRDAKKAAGKAKILKQAKAREAKLYSGRGYEFPRPYDSAGMSSFHMDPVLNILRSGRLTRRKDSSSSIDGSSEENDNWRQQWQHNWLIKKYEALNSSRPKGDQVNMVAARPWGMKCGDPHQHDMPWGSCMLDMECEPEYRIYRGDFFCGRTQFVCCALQMTNYDLYQGIDVSFDDQSMSTDSEEKRAGGAKDAKSKAIKKKKHQKNKRKKDREHRKRKIKRNIGKIVREIRKVLNRAYSNGTAQRKKKTKILKKFVKHLKNQYKKDRQSVKEIHEEYMLKIDAALMARLNQIRAVNEKFMFNQTFRDIVVNGTINETGARMLVEAYPELTSYFKFRRSVGNDHAKSKDYVDYEIEYGFLGQ